MAALGSSSYSCAPVPQQYATMVALENSPEMEKFITCSQCALKHLGKECAKQLRSIDLECTEPQAAWYTFMSFERYRSKLAAKGIHTSQELVNRLIDETGIVFVPGVSFGLDDEKLYVQGAYVDFSGTQALNAVEEFQKNPKEPLALDWGNHIFESIQVLGTWLKALSD